MQAGTFSEITDSASLPPVRVLVTVATYNEGANIAALIQEIHRYVPFADVLVIDDNSPDGTGQIVDQLASSDSRIHCLHRPRKMGLGTALLTAMNYAKEHQYEFMLNLDADFSHPPRYLPHLLKGMDKHDVMIGSRYIAGGGSENWPLSRIIISRCVNTLVRILFRMPVQDASGAYRCYRVAKLRETRLDRILSKGYSFQQEVLFRCHRAGCRLGETPIIFENRKHGKSKVNWKESVRSLSMLVYLGLRSMAGLEPRKKS